jgi:hypothetical protein
MSVAKKILSPPAVPSEFDTGLRFTDILFGFVIRELFLRLQHWSELPGYMRLQLITGTVLVIGSWIGFRRSLNRPRYELKFFNLPLIRFGLDQMMVVLYFRIATLSPNLDDKTATVPTPDALAWHTAWILFLIFLLYVFWDLLGIWMGVSPKYARWSNPDRWGVAISVVCFVLVVVLWRVAASRDLSHTGAEGLLYGAIGVLLLYRFLKEMRTSLTSTAPTTPVTLADVSGSLGAIRDEIATLEAKVDALDQKLAAS